MLVAEFDEMGAFARNTEYSAQGIICIGYRQLLGAVVGPDHGIIRRKPQKHPRKKTRSKKCEHFGTLSNMKIPKAKK